MMQAEKTLRQSKNNLIESNVRNGSIIIFHCEDKPASFHLYFKENQADESFDKVKTLKVGTYDDLDMAITIACIGYGAYESKWQPTNHDNLCLSDNVLAIVNEKQP